MNTIWKGFSEEVGDFFPPLGVKPCISVPAPTLGRPPPPTSLFSEVRGLLVFVADKEMMALGGLS